MRVEREKLILMALRVLAQRHWQAQKGPVEAGPGDRLALALLFAFSRSGDRSVYDEFWRNLGERFDEAFSETVANVWRHNTCQSSISWIMRDVGAPADAEFNAAVYHPARAGALTPAPPAAPQPPNPAGT
ncbi:MAG: hypothetical protein WCZ28_16810 [Burkholderiaceae bacterium]